MAWRIEYSDSARKKLRRLDRKIANSIVAFMDDRVAMNENPRMLGKALAGSLDRYWAYRVGDYRLICEIHDDVLSVLVVNLGNRREIYR